jgi:hypothetical protein
LLEWIETKWIITIAAVVIGIILLDEWAYRGWKKANPGSLYSHLYDRTLSPIDPSRPPSSIYYEQEYNNAVGRLGS